MTGKGNVAFATQTNDARLLDSRDTNFSSAPSAQR